MGKWQSKRGAPVIYDSNLCWNGEEGCGLFVCELFDLTPCAHHNALFAVAVLGILLGLGMLTKLSRSRARVADPLNWQVAIRIVSQNSLEGFIVLTRAKEHADDPRVCHWYGMLLASSRRWPRRDQPTASSVVCNVLILLDLRRGRNFSAPTL